MLKGEINLLDARKAMVREQLESRGIRQEKVLQAFLDVPRHLFVPPEQIDHAYEDTPLPIGRGQTISQPYIVALMVQELDVSPEHYVLDVGAGSGYQTAILARLAKHVFAIERIAELAERAMVALASTNTNNVTIYNGDGTLGWPEQAPFDRIICGAASPDVPGSWIDQLADGGRIVVPTGGEFAQTLIAIEKNDGSIRRRTVCDVRFVKLIGQHGWPE